ncbi:hypothetical protein ES705_04960 [subsurface metagenome]
MLPIESERNISAEQASLGSMLLSPEAVYASVESLEPNDYYKTSHSRIYQVILELFNKNIAVDLVTLTEELQNKNVLMDIGGTTYLTQLVNSVPTPENIEFYNQIIKKKSNQRKILFILEELKLEKIDTQKALEKISLIPVIEIKEENLKTLLKNTLKISAEGVAHRFKMGHLNRYLGGIDKGEIITIGGFTSQGKCLKKGTRVVIFSGKLKKVEDIKMGDLLIGIDSIPRKVINIYSGIDDLYTVRQNKGMDYVVNSRHILSLKKRKRGYKKYSKQNGDLSKYITSEKTININIRSYLKLSNNQKNRIYRGYKVGVEFPKKELLIDPYLFGLWLADGRKNSLTISIANKDIELLEYIKENYQFKEKNIQTNSKDYRLDLPTKLLRDLGVYNNKNIPLIYKTSNREQRLALLAGILDGDGYISTTNKKCLNYQEMILHMANKNLIKEIQFLCLSLGFDAQLHKYKQKRRGKLLDTFFLNINGDLSNIPTILKKKQVKNQFKKHHLLTKINIEYEGKGEYFGFTLDGDGFFLLEDFTVLHNTDLAIQLAIDFINVDEEKKILYLSSEMTALEISRRLLSNLMPKNIMDFRKGRFDEGEREALDSIATIVGDHWNLNIKKVFDMEDIRKYIQKYNPEIVFMDYLQNLDRKGAQTDYQRVTGNIKDLQTITLGREISTFVVSQLSRGNKNIIRKPKLSDLRDSGRIEECSPIVLFVYWEERLKEKIEMRTGGESPEKMEILIAKNRDGTIGKFSLDFYPEWCKIEERERKEYEY